MKTLAAVSAGLVLLYSTPPLTRAAQSGVASALPGRSQAGPAIPVPGYPNARAVPYYSDGYKVGIVLLSPRARLVWHTALSGATTAFTAPSPRGVIVGVSGTGVHQQVFAFQFNGSSATSAIASVPSGTIPAGEGAAIARRSIKVSNRDAAHVGSVKYRLTRTYSWTGKTYALTSTARLPDYAPDEEPIPSATITTRTGDTILIRLEVARTNDQLTRGLMYRKSLDPDSGMVFVFPQDTLDGFWMENTYIPLTVAFVAADGTIESMVDMLPLTTDIHYPGAPYRYAIEVNQGYFKKYGVQAGDRVHFSLECTSPSCGHPHLPRP